MIILTKYRFLLQLDNCIVKLLVLTHKIEYPFFIITGPCQHNVKVAVNEIRLSICGTDKNVTLFMLFVLDFS